ncbi:MAG: substrate-binding domain-containing protein [Candidatus Methylomirabilales bacterium]
MQRRTLPRAVLGVLMFILITGAESWAREPANPTIILATTTSTRDSGLLDALIPVFQKQTGYLVKTIAVGTGKALTMGKRGDADILLTHAPTAELPLVQQGWLLERTQFMHNDFVIVGSSADPAKIRRAKNVAAAFRKIAEAKVPFVSRGDDSGTHKKEKALWKTTGLSPQGSWYMESGQGMGATLRISNEKNAYTLTDRSTFLHLRKTLTSRILFAGDPMLLNKYSVMLVSPARHAGVNTDGAKAFRAWLLSKKTRVLIRNYGRNQFGQPLFFLDPVR